MRTPSLAGVAITLLLHGAALVALLLMGQQAAHSPGTVPPIQLRLLAARPMAARPMAGPQALAPTMKQAAVRPAAIQIAAPQFVSAEASEAAVIAIAQPAAQVDVLAQAQAQALPSAPTVLPATLADRQCADSRQITRHYPPLLRERGIEGQVLLRVQVDEQGRAAEVRVQQGSGWRLLDQAALLLTQDCRFLPARRGEQALASWVEYPVRFSLDATSH